MNTALADYRSWGSQLAENWRAGQCAISSAVPVEGPGPHATSGAPRLRMKMRIFLGTHLQAWNNHPRGVSQARLNLTQASESQLVQPLQLK